MAANENLKNLQVRYYDPEAFPTKDLLTVTPGAVGVTGQSIQDITGFTGCNTCPNATETFMFAQDQPDSYTVNGFPDPTPYFGGGTTNIGDQPHYPHCVRLTVAVHKEGETNSLQGIFNSLGSTTISIPTPSENAWDEYTQCIDEGNDDCGGILTWGQDAIYSNPGPGEIAQLLQPEIPATIFNSSVNCLLSVCHKDLYIGGWGGNVSSIANASVFSFDSEHKGYGPAINDRSYSLQQSDLEYDSNAGFSCLRILEGTEFGKDGAYPAKFVEGERVRIYGSRRGWTPPESFINDGVNSPNKLFRGEENWVNQDIYGGWWMDQDTYGANTPEDIDGMGFESPFFYHLQLAYLGGFEEDFFGTNVIYNTGTAYDLQGTGDYNNLQPNLDPLNPQVIDIRNNNISQKIDSRIKYIIFQDTLGMMNDEQYLDYENVDSGYTDLGGIFTNAGLTFEDGAANSNTNPSFELPYNWDATYDYGIVPIQGQNYQSGFLHNKVNVYIVLRDEWAGKPIFYGPNDSRNTLKIDLDGAAALVGDDNDTIFEDFEPSM